MKFFVHIINTVDIKTAKVNIVGYFNFSGSIIINKQRSRKIDVINLASQT